MTVLEIDNRIEDMQYDVVDGDESVAAIEGDDGQSSEAGGFMSESIYAKLPSPRGRKQRHPHST